MTRWTWITVLVATAACERPSATVESDPAAATEEELQAALAVCRDRNPARACRRTPEQKIPHRCDCNDGEWVCSDDSDGPGREGCPPLVTKCKGFDNPSEIYRSTKSQCIPSSCTCGPDGWKCTRDCAGGRAYPDLTEGTSRE